MFDAPSGANMAFHIVDIWFKVPRRPFEQGPRSRTRSVFHLPGEEKDLTNDKPVLLEEVDEEEFRALL